MITYDEAGQMLDEISKEIPEEFYTELNGGIILSDEIKYHPISREGEHLYILGEYHNDRKGYGGMGRYIVIYFGSFERLYGYATRAAFRRELRRVVLHEFTHHLESLAGEKGLEIKDEMSLIKYKERGFYNTAPWE